MADAANFFADLVPEAKPAQASNFFDDLATEQQQPSALRQFGRTMGLGTRNAIEGLGQIPAAVMDLNSIPTNLAIRGYNAVTGGKVAPMKPYGEAISGILDSTGFPKPETEGEKFSGSVISGAASALTTPFLGLAAGASKLVGPVGQGIARILSAQPAMQVASGAASGGVTEATGSPLAGALAGFAVPVAAAGARAAVSPVANANTAGQQAMVAAAEKEGIKLTAGQATGSPWLLNLEAALKKLPFTSGPQREITNDQRRQFVEAAWKRAGVTASDTLPETLANVKAWKGGIIGDIAERNTLQFTPELDNQLAVMAANLNKGLPSIAPPIANRIDDLLRLSSAHGEMPSMSSAGKAPNIPGNVYRQIDTELGQAIKRTDSSDLRASLKDLREIIRNGMDASISPADKSAWQQARRDYANYKNIEAAAGGAGAGAAEGMITPVSLRGALVGSVGKEGYATGRGDMNELARIGQTVLREGPDSGTAGLSNATSALKEPFRNAAKIQAWIATGASGSGGILGGPLGAALGAALPYAAPRGIQMAMNSGPGQAYLRNQFASDPVLTKNLLRALALHSATQVNQ